MKNHMYIVFTYHLYSYAYHVAINLPAGYLSLCVVQHSRKTKNMTVVEKKIVNAMAMCKQTCLICVNVVYVGATSQGGLLDLRK